MKFRFHVLGLPHTITSPEYNACAFTMKVYKFCKMMHARGHHIIHYGHELSQVECNEHVTLVKASEFNAGYFGQDKTNYFEHNTADQNHVLFSKRGCEEVVKRVKKGDFLLAFWGSGHQAIADAAEKTGNCIAVEPGIGYPNSCFKYRVFESYAVMHNTYGLQGVTHPSWYHCVIPNYFDTEEFEVVEEKDDYFLYLGRICEIKGLKNIIEVTEKTGQRLLIAGQGKLSDLGYDETPNHVEYVGYADIEQRKRLMSHAKGFFLLTNYIEPFGGAAVEAMFSGTPVITTDWGVFNETVQHGVTGYRCRTMEQLEWATLNVHKIDPRVCHQWAKDNYGFERVAPMYEEYFLQLNGLWDGGWYESNYNRDALDWLKVHLPVILPYETGLGSYDQIDFLEIGGDSLVLEKDNGKGLFFVENKDNVAASRVGCVKIDLNQVNNLETVLKYYDVNKIGTLKCRSEHLKLFDKVNLPTNIILEGSDSVALPLGYRTLAKIGELTHLRRDGANPRIAIFSEKRWALGRIHSDLKEHLSGDFEFDWYDWSVYSRNEKLLKEGYWQLYDLILCNTVLVNGYLDTINPELNNNIEFLRKLLVVSHFPEFDRSTFTERIVDNNSLFLSEVNYSGISKETVRNLKKRYGISAEYTPAGVNTKSFPLKHVIGDPIKVAGFVGNPEVHENKNPSIFAEICRLANLTPRYIYDKEWTENADLYKGIDLLICCSTLEGNPLGPFEAASCGIPVISTPVGNVIETSIKTFKTVEQAVEIIQQFNINPEALTKYADLITTEVRDKWSWDKVCREHWQPFFEKALKRKNVPLKAIAKQVSANNEDVYRVRLKGLNKHSKTVSY